MWKAIRKRWQLNIFGNRDSWRLEQGWTFDRWATSLKDPSCHPESISVSFPPNLSTIAISWSAIYNVSSRMVYIEEHQGMKSTKNEERAITPMWLLNAPGRGQQRFSGHWIFQLDRISEVGIPNNPAHSIIAENLGKTNEEEDPKEGLICVIKNRPWPAEIWVGLYNRGHDASKTALSSAAFWRNWPLGCRLISLDSQSWPLSWATPRIEEKKEDLGVSDMPSS